MRGGKEEEEGKKTRGSKGRETQGNIRFSGFPIAGEMASFHCY